MIISPPSAKAASSRSTSPGRIFSRASMACWAATTLRRTRPICAGISSIAPPSGSPRRSWRSASRSSAICRDSRSEWSIPPPTVNAYYNPRTNDINFAAGILQPPFYDPKLDAAANYGAIGSIMGHEMTHGFDDQGRKYDGNGNLHDWWSPADAAAFEQRAACLVNQYGAFTAIDDLKVNGRLTLGENIADTGGLHLAYVALEKALKGVAPPPIDGLTAPQRFFVAYAQAWCGNATDQEKRRRVLTDPHSPREFRANGVGANEPAFTRAFSCPVGAPMVPPPDKMCRVW